MEFLYYLLWGGVSKRVAGVSAGEIPRGRVMTYGQIAMILGSPRAARAVGYAMGASGGVGDVPWQRVIDAQGRISAKNEAERPLLQRKLLEAEGVVFDAADTCDLGVLRWAPADPEAYVIETEREFPF